jgi:parallel beta-helix repeat protein
LKGEGENNARLKEVMLSGKGLTKLMINHRNQINLEEEIDRNMKGKFKLFGHIGLALFLVSVLVLALAPVAQAATAVTDVWVDFEDANSQNDVSSTSNVYMVHFKPATALVRGVDYVTVTFPDGSVTMSGTAGTGYAFTLATTMSASEVTFTTSYLISGTVWTATTSTPTVGGYRAKVLVPQNISAGTDVWMKFASDDITSASTAGNNYKVYVSTTKDTTPVLSSAFSLDGTASGAPSTTVSPATAGAAAQYIVSTAATTTLTADTHTVTIQFPLGTVLPSSISAGNVQFSDDGSNYTATGSTPIIDQNRRTITATTSVTVTGSSETCYVKVLSAAGVANPTVASSSLYKTMVKTSVDGQWKVASSAHTITAGTATKLVACDGAVGLSSTYYSDNATMINMYSSPIYLVVADTYGNAKLPSSAVTVNLSSSSGTGAFYTNAEDDGSGAMSSATTVSLDAQTPDAGQTVYYKDTASGTFTLTFSASGYTSATWTMTVTPAVSLYDASDNLVSTYGPTTTYPAAETATTTLSSSYRSKVGADYINDAVTAAMAGDTVKLGDGIYEVDSDSYVNLNEKVTLTSVNGAAYTTLRPTSDAIHAIQIGISGTAANPVVIDGLTFSRLRYAYEFDSAVSNGSGYDYLTVRNCTFNYVIPDASGTTEAVVWFLVGGSAVSSATISNNTFSNCVGFNAISGGRTGVIQFYDTGGSAAVSGVVISGNTMTDCNDYAIAIGGTAAAHTVTISNNTITNGYSVIDLADGMTSATITGNTITNPYNYGIYLEGTSNTLVTIKNNTITGCAGTNGAIRVEESTANVVTVQYNHVSGTNSLGYAIRSTGGTIDGKYNYYGNASGPSYTALSGATITKSNPNGTGDAITDKVTYYPWLHKPLADVVADNASYQTSTMYLVSGWNTLSTPVKLISTADAINELIPSGMTIGYYYSGGWQQITTGYVLNPCDAVYVKMSAATYVQLKFDASAFTTPSKSLSAGWNLVSMAALDSDGKYDKQVVASVYSTPANLPGYSQVVSPSVNAVQTDMYGNTGTSWTYSRDETTGAGTNTVYAGLGYWVYMQNAATLAGFEITPIVPDLD